MSTESKSLSAWKDQFAAEKKASASTTLMSRAEALAVVTQQKIRSVVQRSVTKTVISALILEALSAIQKRSESSQTTLLVITPNNGQKQMTVVIPENSPEKLEEVARCLSGYFKAMFQIEDNRKAAIVSGELAVNLKTPLPRGTYRLDLYIAGKDCSIGNTDFAEVNRKNLVGLPYLLREIQTVANTFKLPEGVEFEATKVVSPERAKMLIQSAVVKSLEEAHLV